MGRRRITIILCCAALSSFFHREQSTAQTLICPIRGAGPLTLDIPGTLGCSLGAITTLTGQLANGLPLTSLQAADLIGATQDVLVTPMLIRRNNLLLSADIGLDRQFEILSALGSANEQLAKAVRTGRDATRPAGRWFATNSDVRTGSIVTGQSAFGIRYLGRGIAELF